MLSFGTWEELTGAVRECECDVIVVDPCTGVERSGCERVLQLAAARAPVTPVVGYVSVTASAIHAVQSLVRSCGAEIVVRGVDDAAERLFQTLQRALAGSGAEPLILAIGPPFALLPADIAEALAFLFRRPDKLRSVDDLATAAGTTRRTLDRWLARAGLSSARTLLACARVSAAFHLITTGNVRCSGVATLLGYASSRALTREIRWLTGFVPSAVPSRMTHAAVIDAIRPRLFRTESTVASSY